MATEGNGEHKPQAEGVTTTLGGHANHNSIMTSSSYADEAIGNKDSTDVPQPPEPISAAHTKQNQSDSNRENREPEFPFFREKREPWFWFNNAAFLICLGMFLYFTVTIVRDFIDNRNNPPTATNLVDGLSQSFPGMAFCTYLGLDPDITQPDLSPLFAAYDNSENEWIDVSDELKQIDCPSSPQNHKCWHLEGNYSAFDTTTGDFIGRNGISLGFTFNLTEYSNEASLLGVDGYLFEHFENFLEVFYPQCAGAGTALPTKYNCRGDYKGFGVESFFATTTTNNLIQLRRSETQAHPRCDTTLVHWNPSIASAIVNPNWLDAMNVTVTDTESTSTVLMDIQFYNFDISKTTFNPQSGVSMFGSLSGWFGFLSDGWGILSLLFIVEELITYWFKWMGVRR